MSTDPFGLVGQVLDGQFRVDELVGEGGFSAVYRGHNLGLNEPIAIKSLKLPVALQTSLVETFVQRFRDESRLLYRLSQGNLHIVRSIAAGTTTSSSGVLVPFMILEWLNGRSLAQDFNVRRDLGKSGRSLAEVLQVFATAADALSYAHAQGVVHRDLNPGNFFLSTTPNLGITMKVLDFGVAKVMHDSTLGLGPRAQTVGQFRIFAPAYGAPEQFDDNLGNVGAPSDVYSFALVLLEALRDAPVNEGVNLADFARFAIDPVRRPTPRLMGMQVEDEVEAVFARATQLDPRKRWQSVAELWGALTSAATSAASKSMKAAKMPPPAAQKTLPLGASFPFPRPAPRPAAGAPAPATGFSGAKPPSSAGGVAKATQRFGGSLQAAPGSGPGAPSSGSGVAAPSSRDPQTESARTTSRPGPMTKSPSSGSMPRPNADDEEEGDEPTKVAATDPRILKMSAQATAGALSGANNDATQVRDTELSTPHARAASFDEGDEDPTTATEKPPPPRVGHATPAPAAGRPAFGDTIAMSSPVASPHANEDEEIERAPDSGGTLIMAPGQVTGQPLPGAPPSSGSLAAAAQGAGPRNAPLAGLASTMAFSGNQPMTPRLSQQPNPASDAAWPSTQVSPVGQGGTSQVYAPQGGDPSFAGGQSQAYPPQGYPQGQPGAQPGYPAHMHSASMAGAPPNQPSFAFPAPGMANQGEPKKTPIAMLAVAGGLLVVGLLGIGAFLVIGRDTKGAGPAGSASTVAPLPSATPPPSSEPPPPSVPTPPPVATVAVEEPVDAGSVEPPPTTPTPVDTATGAATNAAPTTPTTPPTTAPTYTWPPPAHPNPTPGNTGVVPTPVTPTAVKDAGSSSLDPYAFDEKAARARLSQANGVLSACTFDGSVTGPGKALVTFAMDGTVASVALDAPFVGTKQGECATRQFQRAKVSPFTGGPRTVKHAFDIPK